MNSDQLLTELGYTRGPLGWYRFDHLVKLTGDRVEVYRFKDEEDDTNGYYVKQADCWVRGLTLEQLLDALHLGGAIDYTDLSGKLFNLVPLPVKRKLYRFREALKKSIL